MRRFGKIVVKPNKSNPKYIEASYPTPVDAFGQWPGLAARQTTTFPLTPEGRDDAAAWLSAARKRIDAGVWQPERIIRRREREKGMTFAEFVDKWNRVRLESGVLHEARRGCRSITDASSADASATWCSTASARKTLKHTTKSLPPRPRTTSGASGSSTFGRYSPPPPNRTPTAIPSSSARLSMSGSHQSVAEVRPNRPPRKSSESSTIPCHAICASPSRSPSPPEDCASERSADCKGRTSISIAAPSPSAGPDSPRNARSPATRRRRPADARSHCRNPSSRKSKHTSTDGSRTNRTHGSSVDESASSTTEIRRSHYRACAATS